MSPPRFTETNNPPTPPPPPLTANSRALFAKAPNLGNKENRDGGLGLKTWPS